MELAPSQVTRLRAQTALGFERVHKTNQQPCAAVSKKLSCSSCNMSACLSGIGGKRLDLSCFCFLAIETMDDRLVARQALLVVLVL